MATKQKISRVKRRALAIILFAAARGMEVGVHELHSSLRRHNGEGNEEESPLKGSLTEKEYNLLEREYKRSRKVVDNVRKIAQHLWKTSMQR